MKKVLVHHFNNIFAEIVIFSITYIHTLKLDAIDTLYHFISFTIQVVQLNHL
jgi:hypothetical protein